VIIIINYMISLTGKVQYNTQCLDNLQTPRPQHEPMFWKAPSDTHNN